MTNFDSDTALDVLLGAADEAVLSALNDGLDLEGGCSAVVEDAPAGRNLVRSLGLTDARAALLEMASADMRLVRRSNLWADQNGLVNRCLLVLRVAIQHLDLMQDELRDKLDRGFRASALVPLKSLARGVRRRRLSVFAALSLLEEARHHLQMTRDHLSRGSHAEFCGLVDEVDRLLVEAEPLVTRLFADEGEIAWLPLPR